MKISAIFTAVALSAAAVALTSCQKDERHNNLTDDGMKSIILSLDLGQTTKAVITPDDPWTEDEPTFSTIDIYFTDANDVIRYAYRGESTSGAGTDQEKIYDNLISNGVRFIGMEGVSKVYVITNGDAVVDFPFTAGTDKVDDTYVLNLEEFLPTADQATVTYIGGDNTIEALTGTVNENTPEVVVNNEGEGARYYEAAVSIRPVISRIEIGQVSVQTAGTIYFKLDPKTSVLTPCKEAEGEFKVSYTDFNATLTGVYMSNFYQNAVLLPSVTDVTAWNLFGTPTITGNSYPIQNGDWADFEGNQANARYTSWVTGTYGPLVDDSYQTTSGDITYLFDGKKNPAALKSIPFNFFFPYDINGTDDEPVNPVADAATPKLHFQFQLPDGVDDVNFTEVQRLDAEAWVDIPSSEPLYTTLTSALKWPLAPGSDNLAYANVVNFSYSDGGDPITDLGVGYIYKLQNVLVTPVNLSVDTESTDATNIVVSVTVVRFAEKDVYPVFE